MKELLNGIRQQAVVFFVLLLAAWAIYFIYTGARGLTWQFDDAINLAGLSGVSTWQGLIDFVFGGTAGPSGRPLSLLAFVPDYHHWPDNPWAMVQGSLVWHGLNTILVFNLFYIVFSQQAAAQSKSFYMAACVAIVWAALPIHASGILMPIQRMTHVSAFFVLLGLVSFCCMRVRFAPHAGISKALLLCAIVLALAVLAAFSKESGVLLLVFVVIIDRVFLSHLSPPMSKPLWDLGTASAIFVVPIILGSYVLGDWDGIHEHFSQYRGRTMSEHFATELVILWEYVRQIAVPRASMLGPFHDAHIVYSWLDWQPSAALAGWIIILVLAFAGRRFGLLGKSFMFAVLFYLGAHQIESSVIPLELYFEHRNYLAALGPIVFVVVFLGIVVKTLFLRIALGVALLAAHLWVLVQITSVWGQPLLAAELWQTNNPNSLRANQTLSWQYGINGFSGALGVLDRYAASSDDPVGVSIQALEMACVMESSEGVKLRIDRLRAMAAAVRRPAEITAGLAKLGERIRNDDCHDADLDSYHAVLKELLKSDSLNYSRKVRHHVYYELALLANKNGNIDDFLHYAKLAFFDFPSFSVANTIAATHFQRGENSAAIAWIDEAVSHAPNGFAGRSWREGLSSMREAIVRIEFLLERS